MSTASTDNAKTADEILFSEKGIVSFDKYFYHRPSDGTLSGIKDNVFVSTNSFGFETLKCREFKPNQFAILGLLETLKSIWDAGVSLGEMAAKNASANSSEDEDGTALSFSMEKAKAAAVKAKNKITHFTKVGYLAMLKTINGQNTDDNTQLAKNHAMFITGEKRKLVDDKYKRLDLFYDFPLFFYENLVNGSNGRIFELPVIDYNSYVESSSDGQFEVGTFAMNNVKAALDKLIGQTAQIGLPSGITWTKKDSYKTIGYTIKLYNSDMGKLVTNIDFINNLVAGNMWAQNGIFLSPASLYDITMPSRHTRLYYCTGSFVCNYEGKVRTLGTAQASWTPVANIYPNGTDRDTVNKKLKELKEKQSKISADLSKEFLARKNKAIKDEFGIMSIADILRIKNAFSNGFYNISKQYDILNSVSEKTNDVWIALGKKILTFYKSTVRNGLEEINTSLDRLCNKFKNYKKIEVSSEAVPPTTETTVEVTEEGNLQKKEVIKKQGQDAKYKIAEGDNDLQPAVNKLKEIITKYIKKIDEYVTSTESIVNSSEPQDMAAVEKNVKTTYSKNDNSVVSYQELKYVLEYFSQICKDAIDMANSNNYVNTANVSGYTNGNGAVISETELATIRVNQKSYSEQVRELNKDEELKKAAREKRSIENDMHIMAKKATDSIVNLTPSITHIPDIFNLNVKFTSLLPNNFNSYLYSIENSRIEFNSDDPIKKSKLSIVVDTFFKNYVRELKNYKIDYTNEYHDIVEYRDAKANFATVSNEFNEAHNNFIKTVAKNSNNKSFSIADFQKTSIYKSEMSPYLEKLQAAYKELAVYSVDYENYEKLENSISHEISKMKTEDISGDIVTAVEAASQAAEAYINSGKGKTNDTTPIAASTKNETGKSSTL
jgi:hypothetical protein